MVKYQLETVGGHLKEWERRGGGERRLLAAWEYFIEELVFDWDLER